MVGRGQRIACSFKLLDLALAASAAASALAAGGGFARGRPSTLVRREYEKEAPAITGSSLLDIATPAVAVARESLDAAPPPTLEQKKFEQKKHAGTGPPPICGDEVVADTCRLLRRGDSETKPLMSVTLAQLNEALGFCTSLDQVDWLIKALKLTGDLVKAGTKREAIRIGCPELCEAALVYFKGKGATSGIENPFVVPSHSDTTCYRDKAGSLLCNIGVDPDIVTTQMFSNEYYGEHGEKDKAAPKSSGGGASTNEGLAKEDYTDSNCPFHHDLSALRIAQLFRFYPRRIDNDRVDTPTSVSPADQTRIYQGLAKAEAWLALTLRAMVNVDSTLAEREEFFGGKGPLDKKEVRTIVWRVLSYALVVFMEGLHIKSPGKQCQGRMPAYVLAGTVGHDAGLAPNMFPCDHVSGECGRGPDNRYHVHLCKHAYRAPDADFVSIFVHEVVHHAGPTDITFGNRKSKRLSQADQLNNAANYQRFFLKVVTDEGQASRRFKGFWTRLARNARERKQRRKDRREKKKGGKSGSKK